jgi:hypothetical protein
MRTQRKAEPRRRRDSRDFLKTAMILTVKRAHSSMLSRATTVASTAVGVQLKKNRDEDISPHESFLQLSPYKMHYSTVQ